MILMFLVVFKYHVYTGHRFMNVLRPLLVGRSITHLWFSLMFSVVQ